MQLNIWKYSSAVQLRRIACVGLLAAFLVGGVPTPHSEATHGDPVVYWNGVAADTILADAMTRTPSAAALYVAIVQGAVYNATMAIQKTHAMYRSGISAPSDASVDAAVAAAAHDVLVEYFPAQREAKLDPAYDAALDEIPDGDAKDDGVRVGQAAAAEMVDLRADDGRFARTDPVPEGDEPGEWRRTSGPFSSPVTPWTASVRPFLINSPDQFRPDGPNSLTSSDYAEQWDEVRRYGAKGSNRSAERDEIATFWTDNTVGQFNRAFRRLAGERGLSVGESARLFAMTSLTGADGMITCWNTKYHYLFWRPITAIQLADTDGNPATTADPHWQPFSPTGNHPEYTSGHACLTGAVTSALQAFLGTANIDMTMDARGPDGVAPIPGTTEHEFATVDALRREVEDARIYGGDHFRVGGSDGTQAGDNLARWSLKRFFRPT